MMASRRSPGARRGLARRRLAWLALFAGVVALAWQWPAITARSKAGAAYGARIGCACRYVSGRSLDDCRRDFLPGMELVTLSENEDEASVTARVFPLASDTARFRRGQGCRFDRGAGIQAPAAPWVESIQPPPTTRSPA